MEQKRLPIFAERFSQLREGKTQGEFADFLGISRPTVGFYENGSRIPDALVIRQIAEKCGVSADWLLGLSDIRTSDKEIRNLCEYTGLSEAAIQNLHMESKDFQVISALSRFLEYDFEELHNLDRDIYLAMKSYQSIASKGKIEKSFFSYIPDDIKDKVSECLEEWGGEMLTRRETADYFAARAAHRLQNMIERAAHD